MFGPQRWSISGTLALAAFLLVPFVSVAQVTPAAQEEANRAHDHAMAQGAETSTVSEMIAIVTQLHAEAADLRVTSDPRAIECTEIQANLLYLSGDPVQALEYLARAAGHAIERGDFASAASIYIEAGLIAREHGWTSQMDEIAVWVRNVAQRRDLAPEDRDAILDRLAVN